MGGRSTALLLVAIAAPASAVPARALDFARAPAAPTFEACPGKPGFIRVPGGGACVRVSGRVAAGADVRAGRGGTVAGPTVTGRLAVDSRVDTDLGEVRTYVRAGGGRR